MSDNASDVAYLQHQGSTVLCVLCRMASEIVFWTERHSVTVSQVHSGDEERSGGPA